MDRIQKAEEKFRGIAWELNNASSAFRIIVNELLAAFRTEVAALQAERDQLKAQNAVLELELRTERERVELLSLAVHKARFLDSSMLDPQQRENLKSEFNDLRLRAEHHSNAPVTRVGAPCEGGRHV